MSRPYTNLESPPTSPSGRKYCLRCEGNVRPQTTKEKMRYRCTNAKCRQFYRYMRPDDQLPSNFKENGFKRFNRERTRRRLSRENQSWRNESHQSDFLVSDGDESAHEVARDDTIQDYRIEYPEDIRLENDIWSKEEVRSPRISNDTKGVSQNDMPHDDYVIRAYEKLKEERKLVYAAADYENKKKDLAEIERNLSHGRSWIRKNRQAADSKIKESKQNSLENGEDGLNDSLEVLFGSSHGAEELSNEGDIIADSAETKEKGPKGERPKSSQNVLDEDDIQIDFEKIHRKRKSSSNLDHQKEGALKYEKIKRWSV